MGHVIVKIKELISGVRTLSIEHTCVDAIVYILNSVHFTSRYLKILDTLSNKVIILKLKYAPWARNRNRDIQELSN